MMENLEANELSMTEEEKEAQQAYEQNLKRELKVWKDKYHTVYMTEIGGFEFFWRGLSRAEFRQAVQLYDDVYERAEYVCNLCILDPMIDDYSSTIYAGVPETLAKQILNASGFTEESDKIELTIQEFENEMQSFDNQVSCIVKEAFPEFRLDEIEKWPLEKTLWYYSRAKWMLEVLRGVSLTQSDENNPTS